MKNTPNSRFYQLVAKTEQKEEKIDPVEKLLEQGRLLRERLAAGEVIEPKKNPEYLLAIERFRNETKKVGAVEKLIEQQRKLQERIDAGEVADPRKNPVYLEMEKKLKETKNVDPVEKLIEHQRNIRERLEAQEKEYPFENRTNHELLEVPGEENGPVKQFLEYHNEMLRDLEDIKGFLEKQLEIIKGLKSRAEKQ